MAELTISADDIAAALARHVDGASRTEVAAEQVGRIVIEVGDGIAYITGLPSASVNEMLEFENGLDRARAQPRRGRRSAPSCSATSRASTRAKSCVPPVATCLGPGRRRACSAGSSTRSASRSTARARSSAPRPADSRSRRRASSTVSRSTSRSRPASRSSTRSPRSAVGSASSSSATARPARRRSPSTPSSTSAATGVKCIYVGDRPEGLDDRADRRHARRARRARVHRRRRGAGLGAGAVQVPRAVRRLRDGPALDGERRARARSSTTTSPSRPRPTASSRCCCAGRRVARPTRATSSTSTAASSSELRSFPMSSGGGSLTALPIIETKAGDICGLHPDERHLDHRRADLPRDGPVQLRRPSGDERRQLGLAESVARRRSGRCARSSAR